MKTKNNLFFREKEINGHGAAVYTVASTDEYLYSGSADRFVARWKIEEGIQDNFTIKLEHAVYSICLADNYLFIGLNNGDLHLVDILDRKELKFYQQHTKGIFEITYNSKAGHVYVADADGNLSVWNTSDLALEIYVPLNCGKIRNISVSPDGNRFVLGGQDGYCRVIDANNFNEIEKWLAHKDGVSAVHFDENRIISGGKDALLKMWGLSGEAIGNSIPAHNYAIYRIHRFSDDLFLTCSRDKTIKSWDNNLNFVQRLDRKEGGHTHSVNDLIQIDSKRFATCGDDTKLIIWRLMQEE